MSSVLRFGIFLLFGIALLGAGSGCALIRKKEPKPAMPPDAALKPQLAASAAGISAERPPVSPVTPPAPPPAKPVAPPAPAPAATPRAEPDNGMAQSVYRIRQNDPIIIYLRGIMPRDEEFQMIVNERGGVMLPFIGEVIALNKTASELEREIQRTYIEREIYRSVSVNVIVPSQSFFVQGEVRAPQRYQMIAGMTLMQAIASAGGYTEFADRRRVTLTRGGEVRTINMRDIERDPRLDVPIESGDVIRVPRSIF